MPLVSLSPEPILRFVGNDNLPLVGGQLFTYQAGTNTPAATYTDSTGTVQHLNPIILNSRGEVAYQTGQSSGLWIPAATFYKFVLQDANGNQIWSLDRISDGSGNILSQITSSFLANILNSLKLTQAEQLAGVTPADQSYPPGWLQRYGAVDGQDVYAAIVQALAANTTVYAQAGATYTLSQQLSIQSDRIIEFNGATIKRNFDSQTGPPTQGTIVLNGADNVIMRNGTIDGQRSLWTASEFKHDIEILGCDHIVLENMNCLNAMGDGSYIGYDPGNTVYSTNITYRSVLHDNARRNGMSITGCDGAKFFACQFNNTTGTAPNSGVDIEGNNTSDVTRNIEFIGCTADGNFADGFLVSFVFDYDVDAQRNVSFHGCNATNNSNVGFHAYRSNAVSFHGGASHNNGTDGARVSAEANGVEFLGVDISLNQRRGLYIVPEGGAHARNIFVSACTIINNSRVSNGTYEGIRAEGLGLTVGLTVCDTTIDENHSFSVSTTSNSSLVHLADNNFLNNAVASVNLSDELATRRVSNNIGYVTESWGNILLSDGGTITHGLADTPTSAVITGSVPREIVSVTARDATTVTVAIKKTDGSAGTSQNIYYVMNL